MFFKNLLDKREQFLLTKQMFFHLAETKLLSTSSFPQQFLFNKHNSARKSYLINLKNELEKKIQLVSVFLQNPFLIEFFYHEKHETYAKNKKSVTTTMSFRLVK